MFFHRFKGIKTQIEIAHYIKLFLKNANQTNLVDISSIINKHKFMIQRYDYILKKLYYWNYAARHKLMSLFNLQLYVQRNS